MYKILFVCTGNICRSPTAEGVFRHFVIKEGLEAQFKIDSAGLHDYHEGENADPRTIQCAKKRGYDLSQIISRPLTRDDFKNYDYLIAMDTSHLIAMQELCPDHLKDQKIIKLFMDYTKEYKGKSVPDPYYDSEKGFEIVLDMIEEATMGMLKSIFK